MGTLLTVERRRRAFFYMVLVAVCAAAVYLNTFTNGFVMDDRTMIAENGAIRSLGNIWNILLHDYRPLRTISYALDYAAWGLNPFGYHLTNIFLHVLNCLCLYGIVRILFGSERTALFASLLFAVHPLHTDAVSYLSGRRDVLFSFFYLLGFYFFLRYRRRKKRKRYLAIVLLAFPLSMLSKEMAASFPLLLLGYDMIFPGAGPAEDGKAGPGRRFRRSVLPVMRRHFLFYLFLFSMVPAFAYYYIWMRHASEMVTAKGVQWWGGSVLSNFMTVASVLAHDVRQTLFPVRLVADYFAFPLVTSGSDPEFIRSVLLLITAGALFLIALRREKRIAFSLFWFFVTLLPVMQIIPHHDLLADHFLYLPSAGACMIGGFLFDRVMNHGKLAGVAAALLILTLGCFSVRTWRRNRVWKNNITIYLDDLKTYPDNNRVRLLLGMMFMKAHLYDMTEDEFGKAERGERFFPEAYAYDGFIHYKRGEYKKALRLELKALSVKDLPMAHFVQGLVYERFEQWRQAFDAYGKVSKGRFHTAALFGRFKCARLLCDREGARLSARAYLAATGPLVQGGGPGRDVLQKRALCREWLNRRADRRKDCEDRPTGSGRTGLRHLADTIHSYERRIAKAPDDAEAHRRLGMIYLKKVEDLPRAYRHLARSLRLAPGQSHAVKMKRITEDLNRLYENYSRKTGISITVLLGGR
ncbi:MAG: hypothetical protein GXP58_01815 [Deltaproteobacteria bacterium]|nr:hypothetical protein [Deltaproteobacteria bacterium]